LSLDRFGTPLQSCVLGFDPQKIVEAVDNKAADWLTRCSSSGDFFMSSHIDLGMWEKIKNYGPRHN
jgi:hypothetical protein